jgi:hypothetical protein
MGFKRIFVGEELCCHSAIQLFPVGGQQKITTEEKMD